MTLARALAGLVAVPLFVALPAQGDKKPGQYKRRHQQILKAVLQDKPAVARRRLTAALAANAEDPETWFMKTVVEANHGESAAALAAMHKALDLGLPAARFIAGPRRLLQSIADHPGYQKLIADHAGKLVHGPMLGSLTATTVKVWLRTAKPTPVVVTVHPTDPKSKAAAVVGQGETAAATDFTATIDVTGLRPSTEYFYSVQVGNGRPLEGGRFTTLFGDGQGGVLRIAFGGGAGYVPQHERMWTTIGKFKPNLLLLLGDNIYPDAPQLPDMQRYCYYRRQSRPEFRKLVSSTAVLSIWDDHDFGTNDCFYGSHVDKPAWKREVHKVFRQNWANPDYGTEDFPGCYYEFATADAGFIMLDGRYYREDPRAKENPSMLGAIQKFWLRSMLHKRRETFKILCSPVPWAFGAKGKSLDTWNGFRAERDEIFAMLSDMEAEGVLLLSADRHRTDIWKIPRQATKADQRPYPLLELNSSRLTNQHVHKTMRAAEFSYNAKQSFGYLELDTREESPVARFKVVDIDGKVVHERQIPYSELCTK